MKITLLPFERSTADRHGAVAFDFRPAKPLEYRAGQHGLWRVPGGGVHPFTIASAPEEEVVTLGTSLNSQSALKRAIGSLDVGDRVRLLAPLGSFVLDDNPTVVMLAQGIGVTPFRSMLRHLDLTDRTRRTTLLHVGREHAFRDDTEPLASTSAYPAGREEYAELLRHAVFERPHASFLVSGSPAFVSSTSGSLRGQGIPSAQIRRDAFWGYAEPERGMLRAA